MKRANNLSSGQSSSSAAGGENPPSGSPVKRKWIKLNMSAEEASSALENQEGRGFVVSRSTERPTTSSLDPFCLNALGSALGCAFPPGLASPPRPPPPRTTPGWTNLLEQLKEAEKASPSDTFPNPVDVPQDTSDIIGMLTGSMVTPPSSTAVRTQRERDLLMSMPPLSGPGVAALIGSSPVVTGRKRGHAELVPEEASSWTNTVMSLPVKDVSNELMAALGPYFTMESCSETIPKTARKLESVPDNESSPPCAPIYSRVNQSHIRSVSRRLNFDDIENSPPAESNATEDPEDSIQYLYGSQQEAKTFERWSSSSGMDVSSGGNNFIRPPTAPRPPMLERRPDNGSNRGDKDDVWNRHRSVLGHRQDSHKSEAWRARK